MKRQSNSCCQHKNPKESSGTVQRVYQYLQKMRIENRVGAEMWHSKSTTMATAEGITDEIKTHVLGTNC